MKKPMLVLALMLSINYCNAWVGQVPDAVQKSFNQQYPQSRLKGWEMSNGTYVAAFEMGKRKDMAYYSSDGQWVKTEMKIPWTKDLPKSVDYAWKYSPFASWYVAGIKEVKYPDNKNRFVIKVQKDCGPDGSIPGDCLNAYKLYYNPDGTLIKEVAVNE